MVLLRAPALGWQKERLRRREGQRWRWKWDRMPPPFRRQMRNGVLALTLALVLVPVLVPVCGR